MSALPRISIVTPSFNQAPFLEETLRSVLDQGYPDLEYIVVDGGSTDGSVEILRRYADRFAWWVSEPDGGQVEAINKGLARATGEIVAYLNSDDLYAPGALLRVAGEFERRPDADIVVGSIDLISADGSLLRTHRGSIRSMEEMADIYGVWWKGRQWIQPEVFLRRSFQERVGPFDVRYNLAFDVQYWMRCFAAGARVASTPETLARFRVHAAQKSSARDGTAEEIRRLLAVALSGGAPLPAPLRRRLSSHLAYERYTLGQDAEGRPLPPGRRPGLLRALLAHPRWFMDVPRARRRLGSSIRRRLGLGGAGSPERPRREGD